MHSLAKRIAIPVLLAVAFALAGGAAPIPKPRYVPPPVAKDGWRLEIRSKSTTLKVALSGEVDWTTWDVGLLLCNTAERARSAAHLASRGNRLAYSDITYLFWFPDGAVSEVEPCLDAFEDPWHAGGIGKTPLAVPARGHLQDMYNLSGTLIKHEFSQRFEKHKGRFCLTAVAVKQGLQSNTLRYNGCPSPPRAYSPLKLARANAEAKRDQPDRGEKEEEEDQDKRCFAHYGGQRLVPTDVAPVEDAATPKVEKSSLCLVLQADSAQLDETSLDEPEVIGWSLVLLLIDTSKQLRSLDALKARGNKLSDAAALRYVARFPDGQILVLAPKPPPFDEPWPNKKVQPRPLAVPAGGYVHDDFNLHASLTDDFKKHFKKSKGRFCLTLVCPALGLQSRTLRYNDCPEPPKDYAPLKLARAAEAAKKKDK